MSYIEEIEPEAAQGDLRDIYRELMESRGGRLPNVLKVLGLNTKLIRAVTDLNSVISFGGSTLGRRGEEMIATAVSSANGCHY